MRKLTVTRFKCCYYVGGSSYTESIALTMASIVEILYCITTKEELGLNQEQRQQRNIGWGVCQLEQI